MSKKVIVLSLVLSNVLLAESARLEESVVTGTGFEESIGESVKNITVISKEDIKNSGYTNVLDFLKTSPFISVANGDRLDMRGQGTYANRSIQVLIDGISINSLDDSHRSTPLDIIDMNSIEKIEIIPGGGSVLYGSGTRGGVVNIITTRNFSPNRFEIGAMTGSHDLIKGRLNAAYNISDNIFIMGNIQKYDKDGFRRGTNEKAYYGDGSIGFKFLDNHSLTFGGSYSKVETKSAANMLSQQELDHDRKQSPLINSPYGASQYYESTQRDKKFDAKYKYQSDNLFLEAIGYYQDITMDSFEDEKKGGKLKAKYKYERGYIIGGYDYEKVDGKRNTTNSVTKESNSFYALGTYNINDVFTLSLGDRVDFADYEIYRKSSYDTINDSADEDNNAFEIVLNAKYDDDGSTYIKYERGFISPSPYNRTDKVLVQGKGKYKMNNISSETYDTFEIGVRDIIFGQFASLAVYYTKSYDEIQIVWDRSGPISGPHGGMAWHWENLDETERYGIEAFFEEYISDSITLNQSLNFVDAKISKGADDGEKISYVPDFKGTFGVKYQPKHNLEFMGDFVYYGKSEDNEKEKIPYHAILDVSAKYTFYKNFTILAGIKNLLDEKYNDYQSSSFDPSTKTMVTQYDPADERNFFIELSYRY